VAYRSTERTEARLAKVRSRIIDAALGLISEGGYVNAQVAAVAERARVAVGTVYRHFPSKSDLFAEVFRRASQREVDAMRAGAAVDARARDSATRQVMGSAADRITAGTETFARRALAGRRLAWALLAEPVDPAVEAERLHFRHSYRDVIAEIVAEGVATGELPEQDPEATAAALVGAIGESMLGPLSPTTNGGDPEQAIAALISFCLRAIGATPTIEDTNETEPSHVDP
jgi:AcrR family transcriptional regulator